MRKLGGKMLSFDFSWLMQMAFRFLPGQPGALALGFCTVEESDKQSGAQRVTFGFGENTPDMLTRVDNGQATLVFFVGKKSASELTPGTTSSATSRMVRHLIETSRPSAILVIVPEGVIEYEAVGEGVAIGLLQAGFLKSHHSKEYDPGPGAVSICLEGSHPPQARARVQDGFATGQLLNLQRFLGAMPCNILGIDAYADLAACLFAGQSPEIVQVEQPSNEEMENMRLLQAVCRGAGKKPRVSIITVHPQTGPTEQVDIVLGKGLVFDDGGAQLKVTPHMKGMHTDMLGSAAVLTTALHFAQHPAALARTTVFVLAIAENRIDGNGYLIEDVYVAYDGRTVEIDNTDAEGRLVLADVAAYLCGRYANRIASFTTVATLTGGAVVALGKDHSAVIVRGEDTALYDLYEKIGEHVGDKVQRLPTTPADRHALESAVADLKNISGSPERSPQMGATFIHAFLPKEVPRVVHLDIARACALEGGPGQVTGIPRYAATRLLIEALRQR